MRQGSQGGVLSVTIGIIRVRVQVSINVCNSFYNVSVLSFNINNDAILNIHGVDYYCITSGISVIEGPSILKNTDLNKKRADRCAKFFLFFIIEMNNEKVYYEKKRKFKRT